VERLESFGLGSQASPAQKQGETNPRAEVEGSSRGLDLPAGNVNSVPADRIFKFAANFESDHRFREARETARIIPSFETSDVAFRPISSRGSAVIIAVSGLRRHL
jgi:hypothetical protein